MTAAPAGPNSPKADEERRYRSLVQDALAAPNQGWNFSWLDGRVDEDRLSWDYPELATLALRRAIRALDVDTGGGEMLADLAPPPGTIATEAHAPNIPVARHRLEPLGVDVRSGSAIDLPLADAEVDLVLNRHGTVHAAEITRVLCTGGALLTQQVGSRNDLAFNEALGVAPATDQVMHTLVSAVAMLESAGMLIETAVEEFPRARYLDVGAVVYQLRTVPWQVSGFDVDTFDDHIRCIHAHIERSGAFTVRRHRFLIRARAR